MSSIRVLLVLLVRFAAAQNTATFCQYHLDGAIDCSALSALQAVPVGALGVSDYLPIPGADPANPIKAKQLAGNSVNKLWSLHEGAYFWLVAANNEGAVLVDAPEGSAVKSRNEYGVPDASWIVDALDALLSGTKLTDLVLTHEHWDHMGAAGLIHTHFASESNPIKVWGTTELAEIFERRAAYTNPLFNNNRGIPAVTNRVDCKADIVAGGFTFKALATSGHAADITLLVDAEDAAGAITTILYDVDVVFPGYIPFFNAAVTGNYVAFLDHMDYLMTLDFDLLSGGHLARLGTKADVQVQIDLFKAINDGAAQALKTVDINPIVSATGVFNPADSTFSNTWALYNEYLARVVESCYDYVLDSPARGGMDFKATLASVEVTLRSNCWTAQNAIRVGEGSPAHAKVCDN